MNAITVKASKTYQILIGRDILPQTGLLFREIVHKASKVMLVSDDNVFPLYGERVSSSLRKSGLDVFSFILPHGERSKNLDNYGKLLNEMCSVHLSRNDVVAALGGGVVGDLAGFAAATYLRGVSFVQMPTTLLAAVDSSVGGKTAVDLPEGKNQVGCFYQPDLVICDIHCLDTLPVEEYRSGCAEIIKYAILDGDGLFSEILETPICSQYENIISRCVKLKKKYVEEDECDTGCRMLLNLGHTIGHAVEKCSLYSIPHGQAVAMGMAAAAKAGEAMGCSRPGLSDTVGGIIASYGLPADLPFSAEELAEAALYDKKNTSRSIRFIVPAELGNCRIITAEKNGFIDWLKAGGAK